ncbi:uncharacterized protein LOC122503302 [Leptopilina heterotoma]|uniref:uncharacterized protein LOC122503302 n=1 Tax=Leptopilina heterotoma TaxID=63436 RepID=UPI001CA86D9B|nr:uncharacterized protein LOC122503302 [Leptopilina heterotoma]
MAPLKCILLFLFFTTDLVIGVRYSSGEGRIDRRINRLLVHPLIKKLVEEVERSGLEHEGLYRLSGSKTEVQKLEKDCQFLDTDISQYDVTAITSYLKELFRNLRPSLIDETTFNQLSDALKMENSEDLKNKITDIIIKLPQDIRDTLAYLMVHLQKVVEKKEINRMNPKNIGIVFGPTLMNSQYDDLMAAAALNNQQTKIIEKLLELPSSFWKELINYESTKTESNVSISKEDKEGAWGGAASADASASDEGRIDRRINRLLVHPLIKKLVEEVERSGLEHEGLYRLSGSKTEVQKLEKDCQFLDTDISQYDVTAITSYLKELFRNLRPSLIDETTFNQLSDALKMENSEDLKNKITDIIIKLPQDIRDTLAYLMVHLQKVVEKKEINRMNPKNIGIVFGPTLMNSQYDDLMAAAALNNQQTKIIEKLLELPSSFWKELINYESTKTESNVSISKEDKEGAWGGAASASDEGRIDRRINRLLVHPLIKKLVEEVERSGLEHEGLYRLSGSKTEVQKLEKDCQFLDTDISQYDVTAITSYLKELFRNLRPSLIDETTFNQLSDALKMENSEDLKNKITDIIIKLPQDIRDTLAYLMVHLQKVVEKKEINRMNPKNIGIVFGPTLMNSQYDDLMAAAALNNQQTKIIEKLLELPSSFWKELINYESTKTESNVSISKEDKEGAWGGAASADASASDEGRIDRRINRLLVHPLIKKLVEEVERSGLEHEGLYRLSGSKTEVQKLEKDCQFLDTDISQYDVTAITSYLKELFRNLRPSLIDETTFNQLSDALKMENSEDLKNKITDIIIKLPQDIRDTLAYLMVHLQKVVEKKEINRMNPKNIGIVFGPTLMNSQYDDLMAAAALNNQQTKIIEKLLELPSSFWKELINYESTKTESNVSISKEDKEGAWGGAASADASASDEIVHPRSHLWSQIQEARLKPISKRVHSKSQLWSQIHGVKLQPISKRVHPRGHLWSQIQGAKLKPISQVPRRIVLSKPEDDLMDEES